MKRLQQIWNFWINHPWFLPIVVLCLFGALSSSFIVSDVIRRFLQKNPINNLHISNICCTFAANLKVHYLVDH